MELSSICYSPWVKVVHWFSVLWPLVAIAFLRDRGRSFAPVAAMLVPLAVAVCGMWAFLIEVVRGMSLSGGGRASTVAGFADAYALLPWGVFSALAVSAFALKKRHVPAADGGALLIAFLLAANVIAALLITPSKLILLGTAFGVATAAGAFAWLFIVARERVKLRAIPYGMTLIVIAVLVLGIVVQWRIETLRRIAIGG